jgi:hypothetical protein
MLFFKTLSGHFSHPALAYLSTASFRKLISAMPKKWFGQCRNVFALENAENIPSLVLCLTLLRILCLPEDKFHVYTNEKKIAYIGYCVDLISQQTNSELARDLLSIQSKSFHESSMGSVVCEFLQSCEAFDRVSFEFACKRFIQLLNDCNVEDKVYVKLWQGILNAVGCSKYPEIYLKTSISTVLMVEKAAVLTETSISRSLDNGFSWSQILEYFKIPDNEESTFIRHCLSHCLAYTLYIYCLQKLELAKENADLKLMIGQQLGVWIVSLKIQSSEHGKERWAKLI